MFEAGLVHCDPHPGNILVHPLGPDRSDRGDPGTMTGTGTGTGTGRGTHVGRLDRPFEVVMLDHGMYSRLSPAFRRAWCDLWYAAVHGDIEMGEDACRRMGLTDEEQVGLE